MGLYKIIVNNEITDVVENPIWVKDGRSGFPVRCDVKDACGIVGRDEETIYQIEGAPLMSQAYEKVSIADIDEKEFKNLKTILAMEGTVNDLTAEIEWPQEPEVVLEANEDLMSVINRKIELLKEDCRQAIFEGVIVELVSGEDGWFDMTLEDQVNIQDALIQVNAGAEKALYHCSGGPLSYFCADDIHAIYDAMQNHKAMHMARMESLTKWVQSCQSITEVGDIKYLDAIPEQFQSEVFKEYKTIL